MATAVYRFRLTKPSIDDAKLTAEVGSAATISSGAGGIVLDVTVDTSVANDLKEAMARRGFLFIEQDPTSAAKVEFFKSAPLTIVTLDFGTVARGLNNKTFTVVDTGVTPTSNVSMSVSGSPAAGRYADELEFDAFQCSCVPATGSFQAMIQSMRGPVMGAYKFQYEVK